MSMIYECPSCHTPQAAGRTTCRYCGEEFDSAVPEDAFLPDGTPAEPAQSAPVMAAPVMAAPVMAAPVMAAPDEPIVEGPADLEAEAAGTTVYETPTEAAVETEPVAVEPVAVEPVAIEPVAIEPVAIEPVAVEPVALEAPAKEAKPQPLPVDMDAPPPEVVPLPPAPSETLPYQSSPYRVPAAQSAPTYAEEAEAAEREAPALPSPPLSQALTRALLIAAPIVFVFVLGAVFFARSLESGPDTAPAPMPAAVSVPTNTVTPSGAPAVPPYILNGAGASAGAEADPHARHLVGRWESKKLDYFVFNENMTGTRGSATGGGPVGTFLWTLAQNRLILYADKQEKLTYTRGPDGDTIFLRMKGGKYVQYMRVKG